MKKKIVVGTVQQVSGQERLANVARGFKAKAIVRRDFPMSTVYLVRAKGKDVGKVVVSNRKPKEVIMVMDF